MIDLTEWVLSLSLEVRVMKKLLVLILFLLIGSYGFAKDSTHEESVYKVTSGDLASSESTFLKIQNILKEEKISMPADLETQLKLKFKRRKINENIEIIQNTQDDPSLHNATKWKIVISFTPPSIKIVYLHS
jgi:hypothetical protein